MCCYASDIMKSFFAKVINGGTKGFVLLCLIDTRPKRRAKAPDKMSCKTLIGSVFQRWSLKGENLRVLEHLSLSQQSMICAAERDKDLLKPR